MPNLLLEYTKRHKILSVPVCHNGVCFFESNSQPLMVALTSLACRSNLTCDACDSSENSHKIILELFVSGFNCDFHQICHTHISPTEDLLKIDKLKNYKPVIIETNSELYSWLWKFITQNSISKREKNNNKILEQLTSYAFNEPKIYSCFYSAFEAFILKRKYILS